MSKRIFKYELAKDKQTFDFPADSRLMKVGSNPAKPLEPCLWVEVDDSLPLTESHIFKVYGTGHEIEEPEEERHYVGTAECGPFAWHVFEVPSEEEVKAQREYQAKLEEQLAERNKLVEEGLKALDVQEDKGDE